MNGLTRRTFLKGTSLTVAFSLTPWLAVDGQTPAASHLPPKLPLLPGSLNTNRMLDGWLRINPDGTVAMFTGKVELGQGILTALTQIVSDELDVDIARLKVVSGHTGVTPNEGFTAGSLSIQDSGTALRVASAQARGLLLQAAAIRLGMALPDLRVNDGVITSATGSNAHTSYWEVTTAAMLHLEASATVVLKSRNEYRQVGQSVKRRDIPAKVTGGEAYVQDIRLHGMVFGRVVRPSAPRARLTSVDEAAARAMPGVLKVVRDGSFLAVAALREEQAIAAARALQQSAIWQEPTDLPPSGAALFDYMKQHRTQDNVVSDKQSATPNGVVLHTLEAEYTRPYLAHASIGPSCAVATWNDDQLEVWSHTQGVFALRTDLAKALRVAPGTITVIHREGSGCYGHNGADDVALDAALLARTMPGVPVKLQWMREDEFGWEPFGAPMVIRLKGALDANGKVIAWNNELWSFTHNARPNDPNGCNLLAAWYLQNPVSPGPARNIPQPSGGGDRNAIPLYDFPQQKVTNHLMIDTPIRTSALRTLGAYANVFALESFMDELAGAAQADPIAFRLRHLNEPRGRAVIERVADMCGWQRGVGPAINNSATGLLHGRGLGFAQYKNHAVYCAMVVDLTVDPATGEIRIVKVWAAADAGLVINPDGVRNQLEGGIIQSTSWTLHEAVHNDASHMLTRMWSDYPILRFPEIPMIQIALINRPDQPSLGVGEGALGPTVAAIANAFANATGKRLRDLPLTAARVKEILVQA